MTAEIFEKFGKDPIALCQNWYEDAKKTEPNDPEAVCLATATKDGIPSNRWVLIKEVNDKGLKFHTNAASRKGQEIAQNPIAAINWYWKTQRKQIRIVGKVEEVSEKESDDYFNARPRERQIGAWASDQSAPFENWQDLETAQKNVEKHFADIAVIPRPAHWKGYRLVPQTMEFWIAHKDRLHTRFIYKKTDTGWTAHWLYP